MCYNRTMKIKRDLYLGKLISAVDRMVSRKVNLENN